MGTAVTASGPLAAYGFGQLPAELESAHRHGSPGLCEG